MKYLKSDAGDADAEKQWQDAVRQIHGYAEGKTVKRLLDGSTLHLLVIQIKGYEMVKAEEV